MRLSYFLILFGWIQLYSNFSTAQEKPLFHIPVLKNSIYEGVFTGNGLLGTMTYQDSPKVLRIDVGRTDVFDHRKDENYVLFSTARLPIGHFELVSEEDFTSTGFINMNEAFAVAKLNNGIRVKTITLSNKDIIVVYIKKEFKDQKYKLSFVPDEAKSPRFNFSYTEKPTHYNANPRPISSTHNDITCFQQPLLAGGGYTTAYRQLQHGLEDIYIVSISYSSSGENYVSQSIQKLESFDLKSLSQEIEKHNKWWKVYNRQSNYMIPDSSLQAFYDMQFYKLASSTRADKPALDLQGPWTSATPWPGYWYNLNMQLTYSPLYTANRLDIAKSMIRMIDRNRDQLIKNVHKDYQYNSAAIGRISGPTMKSPVFLHVGDTTVYKDEYVEMTNLTWLLFYYYQHYRHSMDEDTKLRLYDLLKRSVNFSIHFLKKNSKGNYEFVVKSHSPEYPKSYDHNTNYDLSNLRWGIKTLRELGRNVKNDRVYLKGLKEIEANLISYPVDNTGLKISTNQSYEVSHRHYSHLLMLYPFSLMHMEQTENVNLIRKSVQHWQSKMGALQGYSLSGAASIYAMMGEADTALSYLQRLHINFIQANTLYKESGPVIETPLAMAQSLQELSLQYWNGVLRVFPAVPSTWKDVSFESFLTDGAFLVSARYENYQTKQIQITAQKDGEIKVKSSLINPNIEITGNGKVKILENNILRVKLKRNSSVLLISK